MSPVVILIIYIIVAVAATLDICLFFRRMNLQDKYFDDLRNEMKSKPSISNALYLCDGKNPKCGPNPDCDLCQHTADITHAKNFEYREGAWWEKEDR